MASVASPHFRAIVEVVVPEASAMTDAQWSMFFQVIDHALARRPTKMQGQLRLFITILNVVSVVRYGRPIHRAAYTQRLALLTAFEDSRLLLFRRGFWGLRTLIFMGYYANSETAAALGYRAAPRGWELRR